MQPYLVDPKTKEKSVTLTAFAIGFIVVTAKLLFSGITIGSITLSQFGGSDYGVAVAALGGVYVLRRATGKEESKE